MRKLSTIVAMGCLVGVGACEAPDVTDAGTTASVEEALVTATVCNGTVSLPNMTANSAFWNSEVWIQAPSTAALTGLTVTINPGSGTLSSAWAASPATVSNNKFSIATVAKGTKVRLGGINGNGQTNATVSATASCSSSPTTPTTPTGPACTQASPVSSCPAVAPSSRVRCATDNYTFVLAASLAVVTARELGTWNKDNFKLASANGYSYLARNNSACQSNNCAGIDAILNLQHNQPGADYALGAPTFTAMNLRSQLINFWGQLKTDTLKGTYKLVQTGCPVDRGVCGPMYTFTMVSDGGATICDASKLVPLLAQFGSTSSNGWLRQDNGTVVVSGNTIAIDPLIVSIPGGDGMFQDVVTFLDTEPNSVTDPMQTLKGKSCSHPKYVPNGGVMTTRITPSIGYCKKL